MDGWTHFLVPLVMIANGMAAGGMMIAVLGAGLLLTLPRQRYVALHQLLVTRFDPFMPACILLALLLDLVLTVAGPGAAARWLHALAALLLLVTVVVSLTRNVPINRWLKTLDADALPPDFDRLLHRRVVWRNWNLVRASTALGALAANGAAVGVLL
ncbi:anthrone oxygenase family protein [Streptomyces sp. NPDC001985]|uniref:anthrone oxygenase family protein n=1 Tax=Streptomyces sp. NPDC001985 TaxID=3154406 RepID=UPI0033187211